MQLTLRDVKELLSVLNCALGIRYAFALKWSKWISENNFAAVEIKDAPVSPITVTAVQPKPPDVFILPKTSPEDKPIDLNTILNLDARGSKILAYYDKHKMFDRKVRLKLIALISNYFMTNSLDLNVNAANILAAQIIVAFPTELKSDYIHPVNGALVTKFNNDRRSENCVLQETVRAKKRKLNAIKLSDEIKENMRVLKHELMPETDMEQYLECWELLSSYRCSQIRSIVKKSANSPNSLGQIDINWPEYKQPFGHKLVSTKLPRTLLFVFNKNTNHNHKCNNNIVFFP